MKTGTYIGTEFPDYKGYAIEIDDDYSQKNAPCYKIRFLGENYWHDNMDDHDIEFDAEPSDENARADEKTQVLRHDTSAMLDNIEQNLIESIADFLDTDSIKLDQAIALISDPVEREESELHIRMGKAAMNEYKKTMLPADEKEERKEQSSEPNVGYYYVKFYNHSREYLMTFTGKHFDGIKGFPYPNDEIEKYRSVSEKVSASVSDDKLRTAMQELIYFIKTQNFIFTKGKYEQAYTKALTFISDKATQLLDIEKKQIITAWNDHKYNRMGNENHVIDGNDYFTSTYKSLKQ